MSSSTPTCHGVRCSNPGTHRCGKCKSLRFCGQDCQRAAWDSHKSLCKAIAKDDREATTCLLLDGMGPLGPGAFYAKGVKNALRCAGVKFASINLCKGTNLPAQVASVLAEVHRFTSCIVLGWGSGGCDIEKDFAESGDFRRSIIDWTGAGGRFIVQGEMPHLLGNWPAWFGKQWKQDGYVRTDHVCNAKSNDDIHWCKWYHGAKGYKSFEHKHYNAKAVLIDGVTAEDALFGTSGNSRSYSLVPQMRGKDVDEGLCAIALGKFELGSVSFFGDVNAEEDTCEIMAIIARGELGVNKIPTSTC